MLKTLLRKLALYSLALLALGCHDSNKDNSEIETITIDIKNVEAEKDIFSIIDSIYYEIIPLETNDNCLLSEVTRISLVDDKIVVLDRKTMGAYVFNRDGSYHAKVKAVGNGPGEYSHFNDFVITKSHIGVLSPATGEILLYNYQGVFEKKIPLQGTWGDTYFTFDENEYTIINNWSSSDHSYSHLFSLNAEKGEVTASLPFSEQDYKNRRGWGLENHYSLCGDRALVIYSSIDTIYEVRPNMPVRPRYYVDIVRNKIPEELAKGDAYKALTAAIANGYITGVNKIMGTEDRLFLSLPTSKTVIYHKKDKAIEAIVNNLFRMPTRANLFLDLSNATITEEGLLIAHITGEGCGVMKEWVKEADFPDERFRNAFYPVLMNASDQDNPIILIYKLKK